MSTQSINLPVKLSGGSKIFVETQVVGGGEVDIAATDFSFDGVKEAVEEISKSLSETFEKLKPTKGIVQFGVDVAVESGKLTALLVKGEAKGSLKITLEWEKK